ncbi:hypothetical protein SAMN04487944_11654 [Gracilibacillus ureilyticus]|uniref:DUF3953 domain-containing protein n=1 Tax=Gracilibacillus ureilyticus TaxID=531814 RepID=A0A1H9U7J6_9BACI|nr:hypothetical protein [Gracilibacillus ureilyticus]SES05114.1 hypothetical protein SAMN04487944_11654 [Gracilibacillus ureilyticus]
MSEDTWRKLSRVSMIISLLIFSVIVVFYFDNPYEVKTTPIGIVLLGILFLCCGFGIFVRYREKTEGNVLKALWYTVCFMIAAYAMTRVVDRFL